MLHDNEGIVIVIKGVHYRVLQEPTYGIVRIRQTQREREREGQSSENINQSVCSDSHQLGNQFLAGNQPKTVSYLAVCYGNLVTVVSEE
jgi:hypothetical protein